MTTVNSDAPTRRPMTDARRSWLAMVPSVIVSVGGATLALILTDLDPDMVRWMSVLWTWSTFTLFHSLFTWLAYRGRTDDQLLARFGAEKRREGRKSRRSAFVRWLTGTSSAPSWSVQVSAMALLGVGVLLLNSSLRTGPLMLSAGLLVVSSWVNVWIMFTVQYARTHLSSPGFEFPGSQTRSFSDYLYLALAVQTTFGATDVQITTTEMRKLSMNHTLVAFAFNTVILAMVISLIMGGISG
ncbi:DUF1345 domain-containing protein [Enemella sp. A6]|uniref:DUF1345 domain-containing protein n=1 Tax=Enemella sp. A6 TaxID=3440152 RepID=UPI003EBA4B3A